MTSINKNKTELVSKVSVVYFDEGGGGGGGEGYRFVNVILLTWPNF